MQKNRRRRPTGTTQNTLAIALALFVQAGCNSTMPSAHLGSHIRLPVPSAQPEETHASMPDNDAGEQAAPDDAAAAESEHYVLTAHNLIALTFDTHPDIRSSYQRFKSEEARYDFFYASRDSLTPRLSVTNNFSESRADETVTRDRSHITELSLEKRFFDTTEMNVGVGWRSDATDQAIGDNPYISADLRYPLWASRERLERTSEEIFRRNELNDAQLDYIQKVRRQISSAQFQHHELSQVGRTADHNRAWLSDLEALARRMDEAANRDLAEDRKRIEAEITRIAADVGVAEGWYDVQTAHLKLETGLPFEVTIELRDEHFNPFKGATLEQLLEASTKTDPEIATLRNAMQNAQTQYELAKRGRWDIALLMNGSSSFEGRGEDEGVSDWAASVGIDVSVVDSRVTDSLMRQAQANIARFKFAIDERKNGIYVDTLEPLIRLETIGASRDELVGNLPRYERDYQQGVEEFLAGALNVDDLLKRREDLFDRQENISQQTFLLRANVTQLCRATGKFFELLDGRNGPASATGTGSQPAE